MPPRRTRAAAKGPEKGKEKPSGNTSVTIEMDDDQGTAGDGDANKTMDESATDGETSVHIEDMTDITEISLIEDEPQTETTAKDDDQDSTEDATENRGAAEVESKIEKENIFKKLTEADADKEISKDKTLDDQGKSTANGDTEEVAEFNEDDQDNKTGDAAHNEDDATDMDKLPKESNEDLDDAQEGDTMEDELDIVVKEDDGAAKKEAEKKAVKTPVKSVKKEVKKEVKTPSQTIKQEVKTPAKEDKTPAKEEKEVIPATAEEKQKQIQELREKMPLPESFNKLRQLTVNIGPIKVDDLKSVDLHSILRLTSDFEIKFEKKDVSTDEKEKSSRKESLGYVRIPFEIKTPQFFILIHDKLATLKIDGRDMSVKFPEQFNIALNDAKKYADTSKKRFEKLQSLIAEEKKRTLLVKNLPTNVEVDTLKALFPESVSVKLIETTKGVGGAFMVFKSRELAKKCLRTNKDVNIEDKKVLLSLQVDDTKLSRMEKKASIDSRRGTRGSLRGAPRGRTAFRAGRGGSARGGGPMARGAQFSRAVGNPIRERIARLRQQEELRTRQRQAMMVKQEAMAKANMMNAAASDPLSQGFGGQLGVPNMMADLIKMQAQALARSAMGPQSADDGMLSMNIGQGMQSSDRGRGFMDTSPARGNQSQFSPGNQGRQSFMDRPSPGGGGGSQFDRSGRQNTEDRRGSRGGPARGRIAEQTDKFGQKDTGKPSPRGGGGFQSPKGVPETGGGGRSRGGRGRNRRRGSGLSDRPSQAESQERNISTSAAAKLPSEDDPAAMMAYLKSTLAKMEEKISQKTPSQSKADSFRNTGRGDKRKMDYDDYGRETAKRGAGYGQSDYDRQGSHGGQSSYSRQSDYGTSSGYGNQSGYGTQSSHTSQAGYGNQSTSYGNQSSSYGNQSSSFGNQSSYGNQSGFGTQSGSGYGSQSGYGQMDSYGGRSDADRYKQEDNRRYSGGGGGGLSGNYGNQGYSSQWGSRY